MADFAVFNLDGTGEVILPPPQQVTWEEPFIEESFDRTPSYDVFRVVTWAWQGPLLSTYYDAIVNKRASNGAIRFRTMNNTGTMVELIGKTDRFPAATRKSDAWYGVAVQFWMALEI